MTFFANSGISLPEMAMITSEAGTSSLQAASEMFSLFANLEAREISQDRARQSVNRDAVAKCVELLGNASQVYRQISRQVGEASVEGLNPDELAMAGLDIYLYGRWWGLSRSPFGKLSLADLYAELSIRISSLARSLETLTGERFNSDLAYEVFQIMNQWENVASLARMIAVLNRREQNNIRAR